MLPLTGWDQIDADLRRSFGRRGVAPEVLDDLVQQAAERLVRGLRSLEDPGAVGPYVGRVVRSVWVDHLRRRRPSESLPELVAPEAEIDLTDEVISWLPAMVAQLPERYREVMTLVELEGRSQKEAAAMLGLSPSGARTRVQRGRVLLRAVIEACCAVERSEGRVTGYVVRDCGCEP